MALIDVMFEVRWIQILRDGTSETDGPVFSHCSTLWSSLWRHCCLSDGTSDTGGPVNGQHHGRAHGGTAASNYKRSCKKMCGTSEG